jgi:hypothetical protein
LTYIFTEFVDRWAFAEVDFDVSPSNKGFDWCYDVRVPKFLALPHLVVLGTFVDLQELGTCHLFSDKKKRHKSQSSGILEMGRVPLHWVALHP